MSHYIYMHNDIQKIETPMNTQNPETTPRPLGFWLKTVDRQLAAQFATAFEAEGASRRDWRLLNIIDGTAESDRPLRGPRVRALAERGWIARANDTWTLTEEGRAAKERLSVAVEEVRARVRGAVPADDLATTLSTLETLARSLGWDENAPRPRKVRGRFGHPARDHRSHCHSRDEHGEHHGHHRHDGMHDDGRRDRHQGHHMRHGDHGHHDGIRRSERAYARGFDAGFLRGRDA